MRESIVISTTIMLLLAALAGLGAQWAGFPLPFMLGPIIVGAVVATLLPRALPQDYKFPPRLRAVFIALIGLMIGAQITPDLFLGWRAMLPSLASVALFVLCAQGLNYAIFTRIGGYDPATAFYASSPGGLFESIQLGEEAGADLPRLMLQQFLRIVVVVTFLPIGLSIYEGELLGSSAGLSLGHATVDWGIMAISIVAALAGVVIGTRARLPAGPLIGPLLIGAGLTLTGLVPVELPLWLINAAQVVVGFSLGIRFVGVDSRLILRGIGLTFLSVGAMLLLGIAFAFGLQSVTGQPIDVLLISFAPGGVTEMSLIALSLDANPAFVAMHHTFRILVTILMLSLSARLIRRMF